MASKQIVLAVIRLIVKEELEVERKEVDKAEGKKPKRKNVRKVV